LTLNQLERPMTRGNFMVNTFGFGGSNCTLIFGRSD
jgi:3-oxoacyl-(acyl-carrier-protein) synthase